LDGGFKFPERAKVHENFFTAFGVVGARGNCFGHMHENEGDEGKRKY